MNRWACTASVFALLLSVSLSRSQEVDVYHTLVKSSRVVLLPFLNLSDWPGLRDEVMQEVRARLAVRELELADPDQTADALRAARLRNPTELGVAELHALSQELAAAYVLTGTIHRFECTPEAAEISLAARLIYVPELRVEWANSAAYYSGGAASLFSRNIGGDTARVITRGVRRLMQGFAVGGPGTRRPVVELRGRGRGGPRDFPCCTLAVVPLANETLTEFGGELVTDQLYASLFRRGFTLSESGRVREVMLAGDDLSRGQAAQATLRHLREDLAVDLVLTGTLSSLSSATATRSSRST